MPLAAVVLACGDPVPPAARPTDVSNHVEVSPAHGSDRVDPDRHVVVASKAKGSRITDVLVTDAAGRALRGELAPGGVSWRSSAPLAAGLHYTVRVRTVNRKGHEGRGAFAFTTAPADKLLRATLTPSDGGTYGVGQPVTAQLSHAVTDRAARALVERGLRVTSRPEVTGHWHWVDDRTLHYRPKDYWPARAAVTVRSALHGVQVQPGLHGGPDASARFTTGHRVEAVVDAAAHRMTVYRDGTPLRVIPVTTGKPGFETRNGTKVVLERQALVRMRSTTVGIPEGSAESYDLQVRWATRITWSGEYVHAAPWSAGHHGRANVSHGCTGMSEEAARWFYDLVRPGDLVKVVGSRGETMPAFGNGFGDWNLPWDRWRAGSALNQATEGAFGGRPVAEGARLRPLAG
ncbi:L,D-transpeptidase [Streptomyces capparidis]